MAIQRTIDNFWSHVAIVDDKEKCWEWQKGKFGTGYGQVWNGKRPILAHRHAYVLTHGQIPDKLEIRHTCDNPPCCNPNHLIPGTHKQNMGDAALRKRIHAIPRPGESNPAAKLTLGQVFSIKQEYIPGKVTLKQLGDKYGVSLSMIHLIIKGKKWASADSTPETVASNGRA